MIFGIGTDLCSISRMRHAVRSEHFVEKIFAEEEQVYAQGKADPACHFASAYAAKEALAKASGLGMFGLGLRESWVRRTEAGPVIEYTEELRLKLEERGIRKCHLSLTHEGDYALAFVVLEG